MILPLREEVLDSVPDPDGFVTFGLPGSVYFFTDPDASYSATQLFDQIDNTKSHVGIFIFALWSPIDFI